MTFAGLGVLAQAMLSAFLARSCSQRVGIIDVYTDSIFMNSSFQLLCMLSDCKVSSRGRTDASAGRGLCIVQLGEHAILWLHLLHQ